MDAAAVTLSLPTEWPPSFSRLSARPPPRAVSRVRAVASMPRASVAAAVASSAESAPSCRWRVRARMAGDEAVLVTEGTGLGARVVQLGEAGVDDGAGWYGNFPPGGGDGGGGGDGDEEDDQVEPILSFEQAVQVAEKRGVSLTSLPAGMACAAKIFSFSKLALLNYLEMQKAYLWPLGPTSDCYSFLRNSWMLLDPASLFTNGTKIDTCRASFAEVHKRCNMYFSRLCARDMLVGLVTVLPLLSMLAPYAQFGGSQSGRISVSGAGRPEYRFLIQQWIGTFIYKGILYTSVVFVCGFMGQGIANWIMSAKRSLMQSIRVPPSLKALWDGFCAALALRLLWNFMERRKEMKETRERKKKSGGTGLKITVIEVDSIQPSTQIRVSQQGELSVILCPTTETSSALSKTAF